MVNEEFIQDLQALVSTIDLQIEKYCALKQYDESASLRDIKKIVVEQIKTMNK